jgi:hypothetical protein
MCSSQAFGANIRNQSLLALAWGRVAICLVSLLVLGCGGGGDPLVPVSGKVSYQGKPLPRGTVSLRADKTKGNTTDHQPTGSIGPDGTFKVFTAGREGAPPGWYKVVIFATEEDRPSAAAHPGLPQTVIPHTYNQPGTTPLAIEVQADGDPRTHQFDLVGTISGGGGTR